ncbi:MAG: S9 family peptidase [Pseudomonadales bacterium]
MTLLTSPAATPSPTSFAMHARLQSMISISSIGWFLARRLMCVCARVGSLSLACLWMSLNVPTVLASPYEPEDLYLFERISEPALSPDEAWVAYVVSKKLEDKDEYQSQIWLSDLETGRSHAVTAEPHGAGTPRFSPDGQWLAMLAERPTGEDEETAAQVCLIPMTQPGAVTCVTDVDDGVIDFVFSPDSQSLVLVIEPKTDNKPAYIPEDTAAPIVLDRFLFKHDNAGYLQNTTKQLVHFDLETQTSTPLSDPRFDALLPSFSPDGRHVAFVSKRGDDPDRHHNWDVFEKAVGSDEPERRLTRSTGPDGDPDWWHRPTYAPDGKSLLYLDGGAAEDIWYAMQTVGEIDLLTGSITNRSAHLDRHCTSADWAPDGASIYCLLEDDRSVVLAQLDPNQRSPYRLTQDRSVVQAFIVGRSGILVLQSSINQPPELLWKLGDQDWRSVTNHNTWSKDRTPLVVGEVIAKPTEGNRPSVHAVMLSPSESPEPMPTLIHLHGGPVAQHQYDFDIEQHIMTSAGYRVVAPNPRGSSGRGFNYQYAIWADWGGPDGLDIQSVTDTLLRSGLTDPERLGVYGWSYGGMLTNYSIARDSRYRAAVSGAGIANMLGGFGVDHYIVAWEQEVGLPWDNLEGWLKVSYPFFEAPAIKTPTLFLVGEADFNVPAVGSEQMYQALKRLNVPTQLVIYPGQHHGFTTPSYELDVMKRHLGWFERYLRRAE